MKFIIHISNSATQMRVGVQDFEGTLDEAVAAAYKWLDSGDFTKDVYYDIEIETVV